MEIKKIKIQEYFQPAFVICVLVLAAAAIGMSMTMNKLGIILEKEPLPLRKSLELLDENGLEPYEVVPPKLKIENKEVLKSLGTNNYIQWILEDTEESAESPVKRFLLFVTYYRLPDRVPHVPEECWTGGGYQRLGGAAVTLDVENEAGFKARIPAKYLVFGPRNTNLFQGRQRIPNLYFFRVNGQYAGSREDARIALNKNLFGESSYFCKVEVVFDRSDTTPSKKAVVEASEKLMSVILPVLEQKHWPEQKR